MKHIQPSSLCVLAEGQSHSCVVTGGLPVVQFVESNTPLHQAEDSCPALAAEACMYDPCLIGSV